MKKVYLYRNVKQKPLEGRIRRQEVNKKDMKYKTNQIYLGDCLEVHKKIPSKSIDLIVTDLPYGVTRNDWDSKVDLEELWKDYKRIIKDRGVIILFGQGMFTAELMMSNQKMWRYNLIWDKKLPTGFLNAKRQPMRVHEDIVVFYKKAPTYNPQMEEVGKPVNSKGDVKKHRQKQVNNNYGAFEVLEDRTDNLTKRYPKSILRFQKPHPSVSEHPTQKPEELIRYLIRMYSNPGDTVLDSTMGSGTTPVSAKKEGREYIGVEQEEKYYKIAERRIRQVEVVEE